MQGGSPFPFLHKTTHMLCSQNTGKYLYARYARERAKAMEDKTPYSTEEQEYLDITGTDGTGVHQDETFKIDTDPLDSNPLKQSSPETGKIDIRNLPQMGGKV